MSRTLGGFCWIFMREIKSWRQTFLFFCFFLMLKLTGSCSKTGWTCLRPFFKQCFHLINSSAATDPQGQLLKGGLDQPAPFLMHLQGQLLESGFDQPALVFKTRNIYREVPAAWSSSKSLVRAVSIPSSLMRCTSCFFSVSDRSPSFWRARPHVIVLVDLRENQAKFLLGDLIVGQRGRDPVCDCSCFLALASSLRQINLLPAPSNPQAITPDWRPTATGAAIIVVNSPTPMAAMAASATESRCRPCTTLAPGPLGYPALLYSEALKSHSFSMRDLTSATCWSRWLSPVVSSGG